VRQIHLDLFSNQIAFCVDQLALRAQEAIMSGRNLVVVSSNFVYTFPRTLLEVIQSAAVAGQTVTKQTILGGSEWGAKAERRTYQRISEMPGPLGLISISRAPQPEWLPVYKKANIPIVVIDEQMEGVSTVSTDNYKGGYMAGEYLCKLARHNIAIIVGNTAVPGSYNAVNRLSGFVDALKACGRSLDAGNIIQVKDYSYAEGGEIMKAWHGNHRAIDAVFVAAGDDCAIGLMRAACELGIEVPRQLAVVGYDDLPAANSTSPSLTTIKQPIEEMAMAAYEIASAPGDIYVRTPKMRVFAPALVVRKSA
jgi:DNA-binding LacI/PurR family transcriptional regulator